MLVSEADWRAIQETSFLQAVPGMGESIRQARDEHVVRALRGVYLTVLADSGDGDCTRDDRTADPADVGGG